MDSGLRANGTDVMMRRFSIYAQLGLMSSFLLAGCGDAPNREVTFTPQTGLSEWALSSDIARLEPNLLSAEMVVAATHFEGWTSAHHANDSMSLPIAEVVQPLESSRLPPINPTNNVLPSAVSYPDTADICPAPPMSRLPTVQLHYYPVATNLAIGGARAQRAIPISLPSSEVARKAALQKRRSTPATSLKPPLPPLASNVTDPDCQAEETWIASAGSLAAVADQVDTITTRAFALAEKGALFSAKAEFHQALRAMAQALDAQHGGREFSKALGLGLKALEEAADFAAHAQHGPMVDVELVVDSHQTPLLKPYNLSSVSPVVAMQRYYTFAQEQLVRASGRALVASRVFYGLGKLHMVLGEASTAAERLHGPSAIAFQQTALLIDPTNYLAANELGVLLARFGKYPEARSILQHAIGIRPMPEIWQNLSIVHRELGQGHLATQAVANWQLAMQRKRQEETSSRFPTGTESMIRWMSPHQFAGATAGYSPARQPPAALPQQPEQAKKKTGFLWW